MKHNKSSSGMNNFNKPLIQIKDVKLELGSKAGKVEILKGISVDICSDTTVAITGPSGAGKSTLMMIIGGLEAATSGSIIIGNEAVSYTHLTLPTNREV